MRQLCNLAYATLATGKEPAELARLEEMLAGPEDREKVFAKINQQSMQQLGGQGLIGPPPKRG